MIYAAVQAVLLNQPNLISTIPTNISHVFHAETKWKRPLPRHFKVKCTWYVSWAGSLWDQLWCFNVTKIGQTWSKLPIEYALREKCLYSEFFCSVFSPNTGKYGLEKLPIRTLFTLWCVPIHSSKITFEQFFLM